jgi:hypothetical protein
MTPPKPQPEDYSETDIFNKFGLTTVKLRDIRVCYAMTYGDVMVTARTCELAPSVIEDVVQFFQFEDDVNEFKALQEKTPSKDIRLYVNRMRNYVLAERTRMIIESVMKVLCDGDTAYIQQIISNPKAYSGRDLKPILDLVKSLETVSFISYRALGDTIEQDGKDEVETKDKVVDLLNKLNGKLTKKKD